MNTVAQNDTPDNAALAAELYRTAVYEVAARASQTLPQANGRVDRAVELVLAGHVTLQDGYALVTSQREPSTHYRVNGQCGCRDYAQAPGNFCKHRLAVAIAKRAAPLAAQRLKEREAQTWGTPEPARPEDPTAEEDSATHPATAIPAQYVVHIQGKAFVKFAGLLHLAHERGLTSLTADFISVTGDLALAHAVATFSDGRVFGESGDATPQNVHCKVAPHFPRVALTRAKARALRDALNCELVAVEELGEE